MKLGQLWSRFASIRELIPPLMSSNKAASMTANLCSRAFKCALAFVLVAQSFLLFASDAEAQRRNGRLPLVRDAQIEALIQDYTKPVFRAAGFGTRSVEVFLLNKREFNAFVTGTRMFINTGAIMQAETPNEVIGVFAHEAGHIIGGHLTRLRDRMEKTKILAILGALAGAGAAVGGNSNAAAAIITGSAGVLQRGNLAYQRTEEIAADRTAVTLMDKTRQSSKGLLATFKRLGQNPLFSSGRLDPYAISHPLPRERISLLQNVVRKSPYYNVKDSAELQLKHDLARAKIAAYTGGAGMVRGVFKKNVNGIAGVYGTAIAHYLSGSSNQAIKLMDRVLRQMPNNPYFHEMKGEILLRAGKADAAVKSFQKAVSLDKHNSGLLRIQLGHALLETNKKANLDAAIKTLKAGISRDKYSSQGHGFMARAYAAKGNQVLAIAASAEQKFLQGRFKEAKQFAARAQPKLKTGSPQWLRLQDILDFTR